jgi:hypothetical protein
LLTGVTAAADDGAAVGAAEAAGVAAVGELAAGALLAVAAVAAELAATLVAAGWAAAPDVVGEQADAARPTPRPSTEIPKPCVMRVKRPKLIVCSPFSCGKRRIRHTWRQPSGMFGCEPC